MTSSNNIISKRASRMLLVGTILGGWGVPLMAQAQVPASPAPATTPPASVATPPAPVTAPAAISTATQGTIRSIQVSGAERLESETIRSYANLTPGQTYTAETLDTALKDLYATELFADVQILGADTGAIVLQVRESPVINRIVLEGNKRIKDDKIQPEIRLAPRQIFTRSKVRADVDRIIELYKRQGRFAATVEPKIVQLDQNRVDLVFEISEGEKSKVRAINILGNEQFSDSRLQKEMFTKEAGGVLGFFKQNDSYDPDRLAADQQKLRAYYLTQGYADFRVVSALAELTPDRRDFVITYVVEEGPRYKFGTVEAASDLRDLTSAQISELIQIKPGDWFDAKKVEDVVTGLTEVAGIKGYAFAEISPRYNRVAEQKIMNITIEVGEAQRAYVERIDIQGNTVTRDKVVRREFRLNEGDAFNTLKVKRSQDRIQSLGFFQDKLEIKQSPGSTPEQIVLAVDVEEKATGELQLSAGYSSLEKLVVSASVSQRNFMGKGQTASAGLNWSRFSRSAQLGFSEPYLFDKAILLGGEIFRRDYNSFNNINGQRETTYSQTSTGTGIRLGFPVSEFISFGTRYSLVADKITLSESNFFSELDNTSDGLECDPAKAGRYLCDELGRRLTSSISYTAVFDNTNGIRATRGQRLSLNQDFAGLGGDVSYIRTRADATKFIQLPLGFIFSANLQGGYIHPLQDVKGADRDAIRITDRFFGAQMRGFDIRGIGPRVRRTNFDALEQLDPESATDSDALGGRAFYFGRAEVEFPLSSKLRSLGLRPSAFIDVGSVWGLKTPQLTPSFLGTCIAIPVATPGVTPPNIPITPGLDCATLTPAIPNDYTRANGFSEELVGNSPKPRLSIGIGVNWVSPFGPLRLDLAKALLKQEGDQTKLFSFNVGTQF